MQKSLDWLNGSWLLTIGLNCLDWLRQRLTNSFIYKVITWIIFGAENLLRGSFLLSWLTADTVGQTGDSADTSRIARVVNRIAEWKVSLLWKIGGAFRLSAGESLFLRHPLGFIGLMIFFYCGIQAMTPGLSQGRIILFLGLALVGFLLLFMRPSRQWLQGSLLVRAMRWWNGYQPAQSGPQTDYSLYLVVSYVAVDYLMRTHAPLAFLTGLWDELLFLMIALIWVVRIGLQKLNPRGTRLLIPFLIYLTVYLFLFFIHSPETRVAVEGIRVYLEYVLWFFIGANLLFSKSQFRWLCDLFILVAAGVALYGIYQYQVGVEIPTSWIDSKIETSLKTRVFSIIGSPNILGSLLVLSISMAASSFLADRSWAKKLVYAVLAGIMLTCLVVTFSRGAWLALALVLVLLGFWLDRRIIWSMIIVALLTPIVLPSVYDRLAYMTTPEYKASSERGGRIGRWTQSLAYWQNAPATGVGLGRFGGAVAARFYPDDAFYADNFYLKTGVETGYVGLAAFLFLLVCGLKLARSSLEQVSDDYARILGFGVFAGLVGILGHNAVENVFEVPMMATYFWFFLGLLAALAHTDQAAEDTAAAKPVD